jgi:adenylate cyclase class 2
METEFEVKILDIDVDEAKKKLKAVKAKKVVERNMRRYIYELERGNLKKWLRLRDEGDKVTLTIKEVHSDEIDGTREEVIIVDDFEKTRLLLAHLGFEPVLYQENKRESYKLDDVEIEIDIWPKIPPHLEVEAKSKEEVERVVKLLGFKMSQTTSIHGEAVYKRYGIDIHDYKELKF